MATVMASPDDPVLMNVLPTKEGKYKLSCEGSQKKKQETRVLREAGQGESGG